MDRATGYFTTRSDARTAGVYLRADPEDVRILDGRDEQQRAQPIAERLKNGNAIPRT